MFLKFASIVIILVGCSSSSGNPSAQSATTGGAGCLQTNPATPGDPTPLVCTEYLSSSDYGTAKGVCTSHGSTWVDACPAGKVSGCSYPPGTYGVPGGYIAWTYTAGATCSAPGTAVTPSGSNGTGGSANNGGASSGGASGGGLAGTGGAGVPASCSVPLPTVAFACTAPYITIAADSTCMEYYTTPNAGCYMQTAVVASCPTTGDLVGCCVDGVGNPPTFRTCLYGTVGAGATTLAMLGQQTCTAPNVWCPP
jgi:hypothetical protein